MTLSHITKLLSPPLATYSSTRRPFPATAAIATLATLIPFFAALLTHDIYSNDSSFSLAAAWFLDSRKAPPRPFSMEDVSSSIPHVHLLSQSSDGVHGWPGMHYVDGLRHQVRVYIYQRRGRLTLLVRQSDARLRCAPGDNLVQTIAVC